ncbi:smad nuclear-interacting protein 1 isoform X1 [Dasypus novemcinctus]|uniref:smad nuclear-interacting protein 1 isoform X1 n=1 Tax=Dasypus novemcinctus TaxID=9361 RepID=UPI0000E38C0A|nr:smad nuclear-interacting protein 1 isoform X2 [Dasypus novemcinctus]
MKEVKSERERGSRRRHRDGDMVVVAAAAVVVKQERLSPEAEPPAHRRPESSGGSPSLPASEPSRQGHHGNRVRGGSRSPARKKSKSSGRRSKSPRSKRSRSPHYSTVKVKQEREDHPRRGREDRQHREPSEQEHRRARNSDRDRHRGHPHQKRTNERPGSGQAQGRDRDIQNLQDQETEREFYNARRREHRQKNEISGSGNESQELIPQPASNNKVKEVPAKEKPSFELSGALLEDTNTFRGVVIKYSEPPEARIPKKRWRLYPFKNDEVLPVMYIHRQSAYLLGRHRRIADIPIDHPSCSKQHAVFQYRLVEYTRADGTVGRRVRPYIIDLGSGNGTFLNNKRIEPQRYYELKEKDVLKFGFSSREYVLLHESSDTSEVDRKEDEDDEEEVVSDS